jgi:cell division protein FtsI (penicillin-binding protein 3)
MSAMYEPGSVMKMFTVAAALAKGVVSPTTPISDQVKLDFGPDVDPVQNSDRRSIGRRPVKTIIAESRNVGTAKIAQRLGPTQKAGRALYGMWQRLGVMGRTGVDLPGEAAGMAADPARDTWQPVELANHSFGQGVATTLLQLATGYSAFMNGGFRIQPHVAADGDAARVAPVRVLKPKVARQTQDILTWVTGSVARYAKGSLIRGYMIGGKTGTAQIWDAKRGRFKERRFNHTFVGFVGSDRPEVVIALRIEEPVPIDLRPLDLEKESFEAFQQVARAAIKHLDIRRSRDPDAGWPIRGTGAARALTPDRARVHRSDRAKRSDRDGPRSGGAERRTRQDGPPGRTADRRASAARGDAAA